MGDNVKGKLEDDGGAMRMHETHLEYRKVGHAIAKGPMVIGNRG